VHPACEHGLDSEYRTRRRASIGSSVQGQLIKSAQAAMKWHEGLRRCIAQGQTAQNTMLHLAAPV
jgi:hypothetical protein